MRRLQCNLYLLFLLLFGSPADGQNKTTRAASEQRYSIAFASFAPIDTDIFIATADGSDAKPLLPHPDLDYNPSFSPDGRWIVFTSTRNGSADVFRVRTDGTGLERSDRS